MLFFNPPGVSVSLRDLNCYPALGAFVLKIVKNGRAWRTITLTADSVELSGFVFDAPTPCFAASVRLAKVCATPS